MTDKTQNGKSVFVIRKATYRDADDLTALGRLCFPDLLRWRGPKFHTRKWWRVFLDAEYIEAWVCLSHGQVISFITFVPDRTRYVEALRKYRTGLLAAFYIFPTCPGLFIRKVLKKLKLNGRNLFKSSSNGDETHESECSGGLSGRHTPMMGTCAVAPSMQGRGVGTEMYKLCLQRAVDLGHKEILASVERGNNRSIRILKKLGFVMMDEGQHMVFYRKNLRGEPPLRIKFVLE